LSISIEKADRMPTTVFFATNRVLTGDPAIPDSYGADIQAPTINQDMIYGSAFVDGINIATSNQGAITAIQDIRRGQFPDAAAADLGDGGRNILIFVHGFDNTFSDAITRAALNREWLAASGVESTDTTVIAFSWPSCGRIIGFPVLDADYRRDQNMARLSAYHLMSFLENLEPILTRARATGHRSMLLAHSMGNLALQGAVENWFLHGNGTGKLFDCVASAAGDCGQDSFAQPSLAGLSGLPKLASRISIYYSHIDNVLQLSAVVNGGARRLGQDGPANRADTQAFPPDIFTMRDATDFRDYDLSFLTSHQYYRLSPDCRALLAADLAGK
jgi:esterase/lipase superfamily enzyme